MSKKQIFRYMEFLKNASFNYNNRNKIIETNDNKIFKKINNDTKGTYINNNEDILKMILGIQMVILKFIKDNKN